MTPLPKWDGESKPSAYHAVGHALLGPPVALWFALGAFWSGGLGEAKREYRAIRSWHADQWKDRAA